MALDAKEPQSHSLGLSDIPLFSGLSAAALEELQRRGVEKRYPAGAMLWRSGDAATAMHVVLTGEVRVVKESDGRQRVLHQERRGGTLGDVALFSGGTFPATALAVSPVTTLALSTDALAAVFAADAEFAVRLLARVAQRVRHVIDRFDQQTNQSVVSRVARMVLNRATATDRAFTLGMTHLQLAEEVGTAREVVVRALASLIDAGALARAGRGRYRVADRTLLQQVAAETHGGRGDDE